MATPAAVRVLSPAHLVIDDRRCGSGRVDGLDQPADRVVSGSGDGARRVGDRGRQATGVVSGGGGQVLVGVVGVDDPGLQQAPCRVVDVRGGVSPDGFGVGGRRLPPVRPAGELPMAS